jgi:hypothetical protein
MKLTTIISTQNKFDGIFFKNITSDLNSHKHNFLIINQNGLLLENHASSKVININENGLSKSRNKGIESLEENGLCYFTDDDVVLQMDYDTIIINTHKKYPDYDIIIFKIKSDNELDFRLYPKKIKKLNKFTSRNICSIEITCKNNFIKKNKILFDENCGLGTSIKSGEEWGFICDSIKKNGKVLFYPEYIVYHKKQSSTDVLNLDSFKSMVFNLKRNLGLLSYIYLFNYFFNRKIRQKINFLQWASLFLNI